MCWLANFSHRLFSLEESKQFSKILLYNNTVRQVHCYLGNIIFIEATKPQPLLTTLLFLPNDESSGFYISEKIKSLTLVKKGFQLKTISTKHFQISKPKGVISEPLLLLKINIFDLLLFITKKGLSATILPMLVVMKPNLSPMAVIQ